MRSLTLLGCGGDGIETDVGKEYDGAAGEDSLESVGHEGMPVCPGHVGMLNKVSRRDDNKKTHNRDFDNHDPGIQIGEASALSLGLARDERMA